MTTALRDRVLSIGADPRDTADERFRKRLLVGVALLILPIGFLWGCLYWAIGEHAVALTPWAYVTGSAISLVVFARTRNFAFLRTAQLLLILVAPALGMVMLGGLHESSSVILWSLFAPLGAVAFDRPGRAWPWFAAFVATILLALVLSEVVRPDGADLPDGFVRTFDVLNIVVVSFVAMLLLVTLRARTGRRAGARRGAPAQRPPGRRSRSGCSPIRTRSPTTSTRRASCSRTSSTSRRSPSRLDAREVVGLLDRLFTSFDELVDRYEVEKIKTIGDCYMVAAGVPRQRPDHAHALAGLALEMRECAKTLPPRQRRPRPAAPHRDQLGAGRGRRDRAPPLPLRPLGRHGEHGEPHGVARDTGRDPDHPLDVGAPATTTS